MPLPNEHACRLLPPSDFQPDSFRRTTRSHDGKEYSIIMGRLKNETAMTEQAYRYPKDTWDAAAAKAHCDSHDGASFEPATSGKSADWDDLIPLAPGSYEAIAAAIEDAYEEQYLVEDMGEADCVATFGSYAILGITACGMDDDGPSEQDDITYVRIPYTVGRDGSVTIGAPTPVTAEANYRSAARARHAARRARVVPRDDPALRVLSLSRATWEDQLFDTLQALVGARGALEAFHLRALAQSQYDRKVGRELSEANRAKLRQLLDAQAAFDGAFDVIRQLLTDTEPAPKDWSHLLDLQALEGRLRLRGLLPAKGEA